VQRQHKTRVPGGHAVRPAVLPAHTTLDFAPLSTANRRVPGGGLPVLGRFELLRVLGRGVQAGLSGAQGSRRWRATPAQRGR